MNLKPVIVSQRMAHVCTLTMLFIPIFPILVWISNNPYETSQAFSMWALHIDQEASQQGLSFGNRLFCLLSQLAPSAILIWGIYHLRSLFRLFSQKAWFTTDTTSHLTQFSKSLIYFVPAAIVTSTAIGLISSSGATLTVTMEVHHLVTLLIGFLMSVISYVLHEGLLIQQENEQII